MTTSFTAWKKRIQPGVTVHIDNFKFPILTRTRPVMRAQGRAFTTMATRADGEIIESWINYPPAADVQILDDDTVGFCPEDSTEPWLTVRIVR